MLRTYSCECGRAFDVLSSSLPLRITRLSRADRARKAVDVVRRWMRAPERTRAASTRELRIVLDQVRLRLENEAAWVEQAADGGWCSTGTGQIVRCLSLLAELKITLF